MSSGLPLKADIARCSWHVANVPIPDLPNATAHCAKRTIAHPPAIAVIAGHAIERAARLLRNCRLLDVPLQIMKMPPAAGRAFKSLNLSNLITILKK
jgi:hypothetical protein